MRFRAVGQAEPGMGRALRRQIEHRPPRKAVPGHGMARPIHQDHVVMHPADDREQDRRAARPEGGIGVRHQLAPFRIAQGRQLGAQRIDGGRQRAR